MCTLSPASSRSANAASRPATPPPAISTLSGSWRPVVCGAISFSVMPAPSRFWMFWGGPEVSAAQRGRDVKRRDDPLGMSAGRVDHDQVLHLMLGHELRGGLYGVA